MPLTWKEASRETRKEKELWKWQLLCLLGFFFSASSLKHCNTANAHFILPISVTILPYKFEFSNKWSITKYCFILVFEMSKEQLLVYPFYEIRLAEALG